MVTQNLTSPSDNNLLNQLGAKKTTDGTADNSASTAAKVEPNAGESRTAATGQANVDPMKNESSEGNGVKNPDDWTKESALKEISKAREEAKATRLKYKEAEETLKASFDAKAKEFQEQFATQIDDLKTKASKLDTIEATAADKKRSLEEKVSHREARITELTTLQEVQQKSFEEKEAAFNSKLQRFEIEQAARNEVYQDKLNGELASIPEKFKGIANALVKNQSDVSEALGVIMDAKLAGIFDDKTVVVNHSVPGAHEGARATKEQLEQAAQQSRDSTTSQQKIRQALKDIRGGEANTAFRNR